MVKEECGPRWYGTDEKVITTDEKVITTDILRDFCVIIVEG